MPVSGHGLAMGMFEATLYAKEVEASLAISVHMDNPIFLVGLNLLKCDFAGLEYRDFGSKRVCWSGEEYFRL